MSTIEKKCKINQIREPFFIKLLYPFKNGFDFKGLGSKHATAIFCPKFLSFIVNVFRYCTDPFKSNFGLVA